MNVVSAALEIRQPAKRILGASYRRTRETVVSAAVTDPAACIPSPPGDRAPPTALPLSGLISTRARRRAAAVTCVAPPAVYYGFGRGGAPRPSARRGNTPPRAAAATASDRRFGPCSYRLARPDGTHSVRPDRAEPLGTPLSRLPPPLASRPSQRPIWMPSALCLVTVWELRRALSPR